MTEYLLCRELKISPLELAELPVRKVDGYMLIIDAMAKRAELERLR